MRDVPFFSPFPSVSLELHHIVSVTDASEEEAFLGHTQCRREKHVEQLSGARSICTSASKNERRPLQ